MFARNYLRLTGREKCRFKTYVYERPIGKLKLSATFVSVGLERRRKNEYLIVKHVPPVESGSTDVESAARHHGKHNDGLMFHVAYRLRDGNNTAMSTTRVQTDGRKRTPCDEIKLPCMQVKRMRVNAFIYSAVTAYVIRRHTCYDWQNTYTHDITMFTRS